MQGEKVNLENKARIEEWKEMHKECYSVQTCYTVTQFCQKVLNSVLAHH